MKIYQDYIKYKKLKIEDLYDDINNKELERKKKIMINLIINILGSIVNENKNIKLNFIPFYNTSPKDGNNDENEDDK